MSGERLVHRVVNDLVDQMVEPAGTGRADVHPRASANGLESLQNRDVLGVITALLLISARSAITVCQRSSDDIETPRYRASDGAPGRRKLVDKIIAQRGPGTGPQKPRFYLEIGTKWAQLCDAFCAISKSVN
jgi:hypothetical protein